VQGPSVAPSYPSRASPWTPSKNLLFSTYFTYRSEPGLYTEHESVLEIKSRDDPFFSATSSLFFLFTPQSPFLHRWTERIPPIPTPTCPPYTPPTPPPPPGLSTLLLLSGGEKPEPVLHLCSVAYIQFHSSGVFSQYFPLGPVFSAGNLYFPRIRCLENLILPIKPRWRRSSPHFFFFRLFFFFFFFLVLFRFDSAFNRESWSVCLCETA